MVHISQHWSQRGRAVLFSVALGLAASGAAWAGTVVLEASLAGSSEVPPTSSTGSGKLSASYNTDTRMLTYSVSYTGLSGTVKAGHFHGPAAMGSNAGVVVPFAGVTDSPIQGSATLTEAQATDLLDGKWYVNLHTAANPGGEVRGQVQAK